MREKWRRVCSTWCTILCRINKFFPYILAAIWERTGMSPCFLDYQVLWIKHEGCKSREIRNVFILPKGYNIFILISFTTDASIFLFTGTGKTTLSTNHNRYMIGDDEHCWSENGMDNIEGGCYAKCIYLSMEKGPDIWNTINFGTDII